MIDCCETGQIGKDGYDVAVIGAGSAGFSAAITLADAGKSVALIGHGTIGGTCVNVGCLPSKAMIRAVEILHSTKAADRFDGISAKASITDWRALLAQKQALVDDLRGAKYADVLPSYPLVTYIEGKAAFGDNGQLEVNGKALNAPEIIITTGSRPAIPSISGISEVPFLTSTSALELETLPESLLVIGAGYIGAEISQVFARAGVKVTLVSRRGLLPAVEPEIASALTGYLEDEGIEMVKGITYERIETGADGIALHILRDGVHKILRAEKLLIATGRAPNSDGMNLQAAGIKINPNGGIITGPDMQTTKAGVFAAGDVTGRDQFVYMAAYGAKLAAKNLLGDSLSYDNTVIPAVVFTDPQVATVGLTEAKAVAGGLTVKTSVLTLDNVPRALAARDTRGLIKLVADAQTGKLLGGQILAPEGADSIQTLAMALKAGMRYDDLAGMIFPYLTTVEGLKLAAQTFDMDVKKLSCCAG